MPAARKAPKKVAAKRKTAIKKAIKRKTETPKGKTQDLIQMKQAENDAQEAMKMMDPRNSKGFKKLQQRVRNLKSQRKA